MGPLVQVHKPRAQRLMDELLMPHRRFSRGTRIHLSTVHTLQDSTACRPWVVARGVQHM